MAERPPEGSVALAAAASAFVGACALGAAQLRLHESLLQAQLGAVWASLVARRGDAVGAVVGAVMLAGYAAQAAVTWWITVRVVRSRAAVGRRILTAVAAGDLSSPIEPPPDADAVALHAAVDRMREALAETAARLRGADLRRRSLFALIASEIASPVRRMQDAAAALVDADASGRADARASLDADAAHVEELIAEVRRLARVEDEALEPRVAAPPPPARPLPWGARLHLGTKCAVAALGVMALEGTAQGGALAGIARLGEPAGWGDALARAGGLGALAAPHAALALAFYAVDAACVAAWTYAATRPRVRAVEAVARRVADGDFERVDAPPAGAELADLRAAIDRMREALAEGVASLRRTRDARRRLFADLAHELATPLSTVFAILGALAAGPGEPRHLALLRQEIARLARLVGDVDDLARLDDPRPSLRFEDVDLAALARTAVAGVALAGGGHTFEVRAPPSLTARADRQRVEQVLTNLLFNVRRHVPVGGRAVLSLAEAPGGVRITLDDDGPGVPEASLPRLGERLYRADPSRSAKTGGHGLGLSIAARIAALHGGALAFARSPLGGLRVEVTLPRAGA